MISRSVLPLELLQLILLFVLDTSRLSLFSVLLANKTLHDLARPLLYRRFFLILEGPDDQGSHFVPFFDLRKSPSAADGIARLLTDKSYSFALQSIQKLVISKKHSYPQVDTQLWTSVSTLISRLGQLREMRFECVVQLPLIILEALHQYHPGARLDVFSWTRASRDTSLGDPAEKALARSPCLRSISTTFHGHLRDPKNAALARIIALAPNLESVRISVHFGVGFRSQFGIQDNFVTQQRETERFSQTNTPPNPVKEVHWPLLSQLVTLSQVLDLSAIEFLVTAADPREFPPHMGQAFSSLKHLHLGPYPSPGQSPSMESLIATCNPLESLSIIDFRSKVSLETIVTHHGVSLMSLGLHEEKKISQPRLVLFPTELLYLRDSIPRLNHLEIDINRTQPHRQEDEVYQVLVSFPNLTELTLHYDAGMPTGEPEPVPWRYEHYPGISQSFGREVWTKLCGPNKLRGLRQLIMYIGERRLGTVDLRGRRIDYEKGMLVLIPQGGNVTSSEPEIVQLNDFVR